MYTQWLMQPLNSANIFVFKWQLVNKPHKNKIENRMSCSIVAAYVSTSLFQIPCDCPKNSPETETATENTNFCSVTFSIPWNTAGLFRPSENSILQNIFDLTDLQNCGIKICFRASDSRYTLQIVKHSLVPANVSVLQIYIKISINLWNSIREIEGRYLLIFLNK